MGLHTPRENASLSIRPESSSASRLPSAPKDGGPVIQKALRLVHRDELVQAVDLLRSNGQTPSIRNALGVCLMRSGQVDEAVRIFRNLVLNAGSTWERPEVPALYKRNFATALLMAGLPAGCLDVLRNIDEPDHARVTHLREAIKDWERSLSFWRRWDWKLNRVEPPHRKIAVPFTPGEFEHELAEEKLAASLPRTNPTRGKS